MSWSYRDKDLENNLNSLFKRRFPRYRRRGNFNSLVEAYLTQWREKKLLPVTVLDHSKTSPMTRVTRKFLEVSRWIRAKQRQKEMYKKARARLFW